MKTTISSSKLKACIDTFGAEMHSICDMNGMEYIWQANPDVWPRHAPVLFPFISNTVSNKYYYEGNEYSMANHGFARDTEFELLFSKDDTAEYVLKASSETLAQYPFKFELFVNYHLVENQMKVTYTVSNADDKDMYFFIGGHPAFRCPIAPNENYEDYYVEFECAETITQPRNDGSVVTIMSDSKKLPLTHDLFDHDSFLKDAPASTWFALKSKLSDYTVRVDFDNGGCVTIWASWFPDREKTEQVEFVCLEPFSSVPVNRDLEEDITKMGHAIRLGTGQKHSFSYTITIG